MIKTEQLTINNKQFIKTYSDAGFMIERDGALYSEADDFAYQQRVYAETNILIDIDPTPEPETDLTVQDTLKMLNDLGLIQMIKMKRAPVKG